MRIFVFKDKDIKPEEYKKLCDDYTDIMQYCAGITPTFITEEKDFSNVPTEPDGDGDLKPIMAYRQEMADHVRAKFGEYGIDHIIPLVHRKNWVFTGIWGTNWSNMFGSYHMSLCRFDHKNPANSIGTLYHETMHSFDALIYATLGVRVDPIVGVAWDKYCVHGGRPDQEFTTDWKYIRHKENLKALEAIAPYLRDSYKKRYDMYYQGLVQTEKTLRAKLIRMIEAKIMALRAQLSKKDGVPRG